ncbi:MULTISPECIES: fumarylacetoacetate hydrolase family protein [unclassified Brevundimonas]|uniref:fumarylacetoacetate hydrolase family protein n=1 Tax=unclassified Brevundimonas TaxID=2622653 RepID=UPI000CFB3675|nr:MULTISPECIES: fumarylacetoacetate hydrolase family protein [unclassified Brevundimonas]PRA29156.1 fumarylacetoacetate hydrolase [Brevundimonas sp. MYb27]PQZ84796.1 fumarylacetoacetate hydrolase [Brevundimonas sp. MYb31]PRB14612.1 fumarylacetoacetate hydrolase [Brevundimonas sp. MYb52]PRB36615.1 fumarylacetoacetate hydrolase [Brevundimonas sp. MYb46]PRB55686.1 fumarylacetoacetate hydrolase [Brevundimonas sp. MYb33]
MRLSPADILPANDGALLFGRIWSPLVQGPAVVRVDGLRLTDVSRAFPTARDLCEAADPAAALKGATGEDAGALADILANTDPETRDPTRPWLLSPIDLQAVKAAGVTFVTSMLERVIEERARGDLTAAAGIRDHIRDLVGDDLRRLKPGSPEAAALKQTLIEAGAWSQYLEVGIGPDAEIFTKGQPLSSVGAGADIGVHPASTWNNPEPEVVLVVSSRGEIVGAALGNDVNLRDVEGRSALLLGKAKDNNAAAAVGPFVRLFDGAFDLAAVRRLEISLTVTGADGFVMTGRSAMDQISRDPADLAAQAINAHHRYPDGLVLFLGTLFAPVDDRYEPGKGFTHATDDVVRIACDRLGALVNRVRPTDQCEPWTFGAADLMRNLAQRGLI